MFSGNDSLRSVSIYYADYIELLRTVPVSFKMTFKEVGGGGDVEYINLVQDMDQ
jgi:hypothetical protein